MEGLVELELDSGVSVENVPAEELARLLASSQGIQLSGLDLTGKGSHADMSEGESARIKTS